ncbi:MAG: sigma-70 family RNA polymerase sigma factor [Clostridia bacterium]|nr:sigma-70 family RNA polymerase sigma factor [Clostridia bacterium]
MMSRYVSIANEILMYFRVLRKQANEVSLSEPIDGEDEGGALSIMDTISVPDTMAEDFDFAESQRRLYEYIARNLDDRERDIIIMRYGLFGTREYTQKEIAEIKGISRSYVSRIETKALKKLRAEFEK